MSVLARLRPGWRRVLAVCAVYLGLWFALDAVAAVFQPRQEISLWYPPAGLTFALLLVFGVRYTPVLLLTDVLHVLLVSDPQMTWLSVVVRGVLGTVVYAGATAVLLHKVRIDPRLVSQRDALWFLALACVGAPLLVACVQVVQDNLNGLLEWRDLPIDVFGMWSGSATGVGVLAPALLVAARRWPQMWPGRPALPTSPLSDELRQRPLLGHVELAAQAGLLVTTVYVAFGPPSEGSLDLASLVYVPLLWIAVRSGFTGSVAAVLVTNVLAVALVGTAVQESPLRLQLGLMTMTLAGLALGALVTERRTHTLAAQHAALHDPLTGLANRMLLMDRIGASLQRHTRDPGALCTLLYCDLDGFKGVNDAFGHDAGDELLSELAWQLTRTVRPGDLVARLGGDEFVVLLDDLDESEVAVIAERVLIALRQPYQADDHEIAVSASIGVAQFDADSDAHPEDVAQLVASLLRAGDAASQQAKLRGGDRVEMFQPTLHERTHDRLELQTGLRRAVAADDIGLAYQPIIDLNSGHVVAVEALARWRDPVRGQVAPEVFIVVAEQTGLIHDLGRHILDQACAQLAAWRSAGFATVRIAVNVSIRQMLVDGIADQMLATLERHGLTPGDLDLEITESSAMDRGGRAHTSLQRLSHAGVQLVLDDFGTGWSSFEILHDLAPSALKIDRSFIAGLGTDETSNVIVQAIFAMAAHLDVTVTAEGVETAEQLNLLRELRCSQAQGFYCGEPMDAHQVEQLLVAQRPLVT